MPDLRTELKKLEALKFDDEGEPDMPITMKPKSERESVWEYIKANPMSSSAGVSAALGIDASSSASQVGALLNKSLLTRIHIGGSYHYTAVGDSYPVFDRVAHGKKLGRAARGKPKKSRVVKDERPKDQAPAVIPLAAFSAQDMIESMPVGKARALYDELKKIFGG